MKPKPAKGDGKKQLNNTEIKLWRAQELQASDSTENRGQ